MTTPATQDDAPTYEIKFDDEFGVWMIYTYLQDEHDDEHVSLVALRDTEAEAREVAVYFKALDTSKTSASDALRAAWKREEIKGGELLMHLHRLLWRYGVSEEVTPDEGPDPGEYDGDHASALASVYGPEW